MFRKSVMLMPILRTIRQVPKQTQCRNLWIDSFDVIRDMNRLMDRFDRNFFRHNPLQLVASRALPIEGRMANQNPSYCLDVHVGEAKPEDIKISLKDGMLRIEAHVDKKNEDGSSYQSSIVREYTLPSDVNPSSMKSCLYYDGTLRIEADMANPNEPKDIPIQHLQEGDSNKK